MFTRHTRRWHAVGALAGVGLIAAAAVWWLGSPPGAERPRAPAPVATTPGPLDALGPVVGSTRPLPPAPIAARQRTHAVWTGDELLVWAGAVPSEPGTGTLAGNEAFDVVDDGAAYDPAADEWRRLSPAPIRGRAGAAAVWADDRLVVWGGFADPDTALADGAAYLPEEDRWVALPPAPISGRGDVTAAWTGREVLIVGGAERAGQPGRVSGVQRNGAAYDPAADEWRRLPPIPDGVWHLRDRGVGPVRERFAGVWSGDRLVVWGRDVAVYEPTDDAWRRVAAPTTSLWLGGGVQAVRFGDGVAVLGLLHRHDRDTLGLTYDAGADEFGVVPALPPAAVQAPRQALAVDEHGLALLTAAPAAAVWNPETDTWRRLPDALGRGPDAAVVWTGDDLLVWGGTGMEGPAMPAFGAAWSP